MDEYSSPEYDRFEALVEELKRSAIDAKVKEEAQAYLTSIEDDHYRLLILGDGVDITTPRPNIFDGDGDTDRSLRGPEYEFKVARPGVDGREGGTWRYLDGVEVKSPPRLSERINSAVFDDVRATIEGIVGPWRNLPNPADVDPIVTDCKFVSGRLSVDTTLTEGMIETGGTIQSSLISIDQGCFGMSGDTIERFKGEFVNALGLTINNLWAISIVRAQAVAAERGVWAAAREEIPEVLKAAITAFGDFVKYQYPSAGRDWKIVFEVVAYATQSAASILMAVPEVSLPLELLSLAATIAAKCTEEPTAVEHPAGYKDTVKALQRTTAKVAKKIRSVEKVIKVDLGANYNTITSTDNRLAYDPALVPLRTDSDIEIDKGKLVDGIARTHMPKIADILEEAVGRSNQCMLDSQLTRHERVGVDPSSTINSISELLNQLLGELAWDVRAGARNLELAVDYFFEHEEQVAQQLNDLADQVEQGSDYRPWDVELKASRGVTMPVLENLDDLLGF